MQDPIAKIVQQDKFLWAERDRKLRPACNKFHALSPYGAERSCRLEKSIGHQAARAYVCRETIEQQIRNNAPRWQQVAPGRNILYLCDVILSARDW